MNLDALVREGNRPWQPTPGAGGLHVWHEYDMPTVGTVTLDGNTVLFTIVGDPDDELTVWAYTCLDDNEAERARDTKFASVGDLDGFVRARFADREAVFALARDLRLWRWSPVHVNGDGADVLMAAATGFLKDLKRTMERDSHRTPSANVPFRAALASVEATAAELADA